MKLLFLTMNYLLIPTLFIEFFFSLEGFWTDMDGYNNSHVCIFKLVYLTFFWFSNNFYIYKFLLS